MNLLLIPLLCKERRGEVESWGYSGAMKVSAIECCGDATFPPAPPYEGGRPKTDQLYVLPMLMSQDPLIIGRYLDPRAYPLATRFGKK